MLRIAASLLTVAAVVCSPWLLGGFSPWCFFLAPFAALVGILFWLPLRIDPHISTWSWYAAVIATLLVGYVWLQATPLPKSLLSSLTSAPRISRLQSLTTEGASCFDGEAVRVDSAPWRQISSDPTETRRQLGMLATALAICLVSMSLASHELCRMLMVILLTVNGAAFGIMAIVQRATAPHTIFWTIKPQWASLPFGAFVNRNHAGLFLALSGLCGLFAICLLLSRRLARRLQSQDDGHLGSNGSSLNLTELRMIWLSQKDSVLLPLAFCAIFCAVSSIVAASRSGALAFGAVIFVSTLMLFLSGADRRLIAVIGVLGAVAAIISSAKLDYLMDRFGSDALEAGFAGRYAHWTDVLDQYPEYAFTGVGFGNYAYATLPYLSKPSTAWFQHADNQYVETFVELGLAGSLLVIAFVGLLAARCISLLRSDDIQAKIVGLFGLGLIGIAAINSLSDFALVMAGVLLPMALVVGLVLGYRDRPDQNSKNIRQGIAMGVLKAVTASMLLWAVASGLSHFANGTTSVDPKQSTLQWVARYVSFQFGEPSIVAISNEAHSAIDSYQSEARAAIVAIDPNMLESNTLSLENLAIVKRAIESQDTAHEFKELKMALEQSIQLREAKKRLIEVIKLSPMRFENQLELARIDLHLCPGPSVTHWVDHARMIHPTSGVDASKCGIVSVINGDLEAGGRMLGQALREAPELQQDIYKVLRSQMSVQEVARFILADDPALILRAAEAYYRSPEDWRARSYLFTQLQQSIESGKAQSLSPAEAKYYLGKAKYMNGNRTDAYADFEEACQMQPPNQQWLRELANLYKRDGKFREARKILKTLGQEFGFDEKLEQEIEQLENRVRSNNR